MNKEEAKKQFGKNLKRLRLQKGMSQEELAHAMGFKNRSSINKIEVGKNDLPRSLVVRAAEVLGVSPLELFAEDENKEQEFIILDDGYREEDAIAKLDIAIGNLINNIGNHTNNIENSTSFDPDFFLEFRKLSKKNQEQVINYTKFLLETQKSEEEEKKGAQG